MKTEGRLDKKDGVIIAFIAALFVISVIYVLQVNQNITPRGGGESGAHLEWAVQALSIAFLAAVALICAAFALYICRNRKTLRKLKQREESYKRILAAADSAMYDYNVIARELSVSEGFAEMFGFSLPKDFFARIPELAPLHPEFDYDALQEKVIAVEMNRRQEEIHLVLRSETRGMSRLQITMVPQINSANRVVGIHGMISDVTDSYTDNLNLKQDHQSALLIISSLAPMALSANLTQNTYHVISYNRLDLRSVLDELDEGSYDDFISRSTEHIHRDDKEGFFAAFSRENLLQTFAGGQHIVNFQYRRISGNGELRWFVGHCVMVHREVDGSVHLAMVINDHTKQMEQQMELQRKYDLTIENIPSYTAKWIFKNGDMYLMDANQRYLDFMGGTAAELFNKSFVCGFGEREKAALLAKLYASVRERRSISLTHRVVTYNGKGHILDIQASYFEDVEGNPVYFGVLTDVTDLVMTEEKLKKIEVERQVAVDRYVHTILQYNIANQTMRLISGGDSRIDFDKAIHSCPESLFQSGVLGMDSLEKINRFFGDLHNGNNSEPIPLTLRCTDGTKLLVEATGTIIHNPSGAPDSAMIILTKTGEITGSGEPYPQQGDNSHSAVPDNKRVFAKTFGPFDIFLDDKPLCFTNAKAKELLAILIDRRGGTLASSEAIGLLWEDEPAGEKQLARYRRLASRLKETLESAGCGDILISSNGIRSINMSNLHCDYYRAMDGDEAAQKQYQGFYMTGYSWAEERNMALNRIFGIDNSEA